MMKNISSFLTASLLIQMILLFDLTSSYKYNCNPKTQCENGNKGNKYEDPKDCHNYYVCLADSQGNYFPSDNPVRCPEGYYFSSRSISDCYYGSSCEDQCVNLCQADCTNYNYEKVADFKDCSSFYLCSPGGIKIHYKCPSTTPYFDGSDCRKESYVCCDCCDECTPFCNNTFSEIADPYDCRSYYLCLIKGLPTDDNRYTCKEGEYFNASLGRCEQESKFNSCKPKCEHNNNNNSSIVN